MFLEIEELKTVADNQVVNLIVGNDLTIITDIIMESEATMRSYLSRYYDVEEIFSRVGGERNRMILKKLKDIVIYEIYERQSRDRANEVVSRRYGEAMHWLEKINTGEQGDHTLPPAKKEEVTAGGQTGDTRFGSHPKYNSNY